MSENKIVGEIIVADNGSTDGSQAIAHRLGARLVHIEAKGYGNALMGGIAAAQGQFVIMGDADDSYNFWKSQVLSRNCAKVLTSCGGVVSPQGAPSCPVRCHFSIAGGKPYVFMPGTMVVQGPIHDVYCGLRGFRKDFYSRLALRCTGMEFATEMIIKASLYEARIAEVPITPDGRKAHAPHLKTFRDGWRTLRFFLMYSPRWLFLIPGTLLILLGMVGYGIAMPGLTFQGVTFDAHTLLFASLAILCGYQSVLFAIFTKIFAISEGLMPEDPYMTRFFAFVNLERGLLLSLGALLIGVVLLLTAVNQWRLADFGRLDYAQTMRLVIPGATLSALGFQTMLSSFFGSLLGMRRR